MRVILILTAVASWAVFAGCGTGGSSGDGSALPTAGLVAYYTFSGNANDESGNGNDGIVTGAVLTTGRKGDAGGAYSYNGIGDYISVADDPTLDLTDGLTISVWIYPEGVIEDGDSIVEKPDGVGWARYAVWTEITGTPHV